MAMPHSEIGALRALVRFSKWMRCFSTRGLWILQTLLHTLNNQQHYLAQMLRWGISVNNSADSHHFQSFRLRKQFLQDSHLAQIMCQPLCDARIKGSRRPAKQIKVQLLHSERLIGPIAGSKFAELALGRIFFCICICHTWIYLAYPFIPSRLALQVFIQHVVCQLTHAAEVTMLLSGWEICSLVCNDLYNYVHLA